MRPTNEHTPSHVRGTGTSESMDAADIWNQGVKRAGTQAKALAKVQKIAVDMDLARKELAQTTIIPATHAQKPRAAPQRSPAPGPMTRAIRASMPKRQDVAPPFKTFGEFMATQGG